MKTKKNSILDWLLIAIGFVGFIIVLGTAGLSDYETEQFIIVGDLSQITPFWVILLRTLFGLALMGGSILAHRKFIK